MNKAILWIEQIHHPGMRVVYALKCHTEPLSHFKKDHVHEKWPWRQLGAQLGMLRLCCVHWISRTWVVLVHLYDQARKNYQRLATNNLKIAIKRRWIWAVGERAGLQGGGTAEVMWSSIHSEAEPRSAGGPCSFPAASLQRQEAAYPPFPLCVLHPKNIDAD